MSASALNSSVLVLNRYYAAIRVISVRRSLTLLYRECAEVITLESDRYFTYDFASWCELSQLQSEDKQPGPTLTQPICDPKYECWKTFLPAAS